MKKASGFLAILLAAIVGFSIIPANTAQAKSPWLVHWAGKKPDLDGRMLRVSHFTLRKDAIPHMQYRVLLPILRALADGRRREAKNSALEATWTEFNEVFAVAANASTFAEHAMFISGLSGINTYFTNVGTALGALQVVLDISANNHRAALVDSYKTVQGYWLGTLGTAGMQIGGVAAFVVDYWLTDIRETTWKNHKDQLRKIYVAFYDDKSSLEVRSINQWKKLVHKIYDKSRRKWLKGKSRADAEKIRNAYFSNRLNVEIDAYVSKIWDSDKLVFYKGENKHLRQFHRINNKNKAILQAEYKTKLIRMLARRVFPELTHRTWEKWAEHELEYRMNGKSLYSLVSKLNKVFVLEVQAYGLKQPARVLIHRPAGKPWKEAIPPGGKVSVKMTRVAFIRAGVPNKISMIVGDETVTRSFHFDKNGKAAVSFGTPEVVAVTSYDRTESEQSCKVKKSYRTKKTEKYEETRAAASGLMHMAGSMSGETIIGRYSLKQNKWLEASVGKIVNAPTTGGTPSSMDLMKGGKMEFAYSATFVPPYFDDIQALEKCKGATTMLGTSELTCTAKRYARKQVSRDTLVERHCTSTITLKTRDYFMVSGKNKGVVIDADQLKDIEKETAKEMKNMQNLLKNLPKP